MKKLEKSAAFLLVLLSAGCGGDQVADPEYPQDPGRIVLAETTDRPDDITDLHFTGSTHNSLQFALTGVANATSYDCRYTEAPWRNWGDYWESNVVLHGEPGELISGEITGLESDTEYALACIAFRGTLNVDAVFSRKITPPITARTDAAPPPDAPVAEDDDYTTEQNTEITRSTDDADDLTDNDDLGEPPGTITSFGVGGDADANPAGTTLSLPEGSGQLTVHADGSFAFTPPTDFTGTYAFSYTLENAAGASVGAVTVSVVMEPDAVDDAYVTAAGVSLTVSDGSGDLLDNDDLGFPASTMDSWGAIDGVGLVTDKAPGETVEVVGKGDVTVNADGSVVFDPALGFTGTLVFAYRITNDAGVDDGTVTIEVTAGDAAPIVTETDPADEREDVSAEANIAITFSEPVTVAGDWITMSCSSSGPFNPTGTGGATILDVTDGDPVFTLDPALDLQPGETCTVTVHGPLVTDDDAADPPDAMTADVEFSFGIPILEDDQYTATGNIAIWVPADQGLSSNDADGSVVVQVQGSAANVGVPTSTSAIGRRGASGRVRAYPDGRFWYKPPPGYEGVDTFTYSTNTSGSATATVTITVSDMVWFIDNQANNAVNRGSFASPFLTIADFNAAAALTGAAPHPKPGDLIVLRTGTGTYVESDGINLLDGQKLIGEGVPFSSEFVADDNSIARYTTFANGSAAPPVIEVTGIGNNGIDLATDNTVRGLSIGNTDVTPGATSFGMAGAAVGNLKVNAVSITGLGGAASLANGDLGTAVVFDELSSVRAPDLGLRMTDLAGTLEVLDDASAIVDAAGQSVRIGGGNASLIFPGDITNTLHPFHVLEIVNTAPGGHVMLTGRISQTHADARGVLIDGAGTDVTIADLDLGSSTIRNGGQSPILIMGNSTGTFTFSSVDVFASGPGNAGIRVDNTTTAGMLTVTDGRFDALGGPAIDIARTSVDLNVADPVSSGSDGGGVRLFEVSGSAAVTGTLDVDNAADAGIDIANSSGTFTFASVAIDNTSGSGVRLEGNGSAVFEFNDGVSILTGSGDGFVAANGGTVHVDGSAVNTIATGTGTPVRIDNVTIGATGVTFRRIATNGAENGIVLDNTGTTGGFLITGDASTPSSGGTIQNTVGDGITATNALLDLEFVDVIDAGGNGISVVAAAPGTVCLNMVRNTSSVVNGASSPFVLTSGGASTFLLQDFIGDGNLAGDVEAWLAGKNNQGSSAVTVGAPFAASPGVCVPGGITTAPPRNDVYTASGNIPIALGNLDGVLANDDPGLTVTSVQGSAANIGVATATSATGRAGAPGLVTLQADGSSTYEPPAGYEGDDTFTYGADDGSGALATVTITVTSVQGSAASIGVATATSATGRAGAPGLVTLQADGSFTYEPPAGYEGDDTFTYGADDGSGALATVTITVNGMVWFVDDDAAGPANAGTFVDPFPSMAAFNAANAGGAGVPEPKTGDVISLRSGAYSEADGINLLDDQQLIGEGVPLASAFAADPNSVVAYQTFAGAAGTPPTIAVTDVDNHGIELAANNTVRGLTIGNTHAIRPSASFGMFGDAVGNLRVNAVSITGVGGAVDLANGDLGNNVVFDELSSVDAPDLAVRLTSLSGTLEVVNDASAIVDPAGQAVRVAGGSLSFHYPGTITTVRPFHVLEVLNMGPGGEVIITGAITQAHRNGRGVLIENVASDVTVSDLFLGTAANRNGGQSGITIRDNSTGTFTFSNVDIFTTGSSNPAIEVSNTSAAGTLVVNDARVDADGAPALDIVRTELDLTAQAVSGNSTGAGIRLLDVTGAATINTTSVLDNATGAGVDVQNTTGTLGLDLQGLSITNTAGDGISVSSTGDANVCLNLVNTTTSGLGGNGYTLESVGTSTFQLQDFTGDGSVPADVTAWVNVTKSNAGTVNVLGTFFTSAPGTCVP